MNLIPVFFKGLSGLMILCLLVSGSGQVFAQQKALNEAQMIKKALLLFKHGDLDESEQLFTRILSTDKRSLIAKEMLAVISFKKNDFSKAFKFAEMSLKQNRKSAKAHLVMAGLLRRQGHQLAARDHLRKAKKYSTEMEKQTLAEYMSDENKRLLENLNEIPPEKDGKTHQLNQTADKPSLAVFAFDDERNEENEIGVTFSEMLITGLVRTAAFQVVERSQLDKLLEEQALGQSGVLAEETAADVGNLLGVDAVIVGNIGRLKEQMEIDGRLVAPQSGRVLTSASVTTPDESELRAAAYLLADKIAEAYKKIHIINRQQDN